MREPFASNPHVIIAWPGHPLAGARDIAPIELRHESVVQREPGSGTRAMLDAFLAMHRIVPRERITVSGNEMAKHAVMSQLGISLTSMHTLFLELKTGALVRLHVDHTPIERTWYVVYHPESLAAARPRNVPRLPARRGRAQGRGRDARAAASLRRRASPGGTSRPRQ